MEASERNVVVAALRSSEARLLELVCGLTAEQWKFREAPERWTIAEIVEHLVLFEEFIRGAVERALKSAAANEERRAEVRTKEPLVMGLAEARATERLEAREVTRPMGRWADFDAMVVELWRARAGTIAFAEETDADLRGHFFAHIAFGDMDCYQWLMLLAKHMERHAFQIEQVKLDSRWAVISALK